MDFAMLAEGLRAESKLRVTSCSLFRMSLAKAGRRPLALLGTQLH